MEESPTAGLMAARAPSARYASPTRSCRLIVIIFHLPHRFAQLGAGVANIRDISPAISLSFRIVDARTTTFIVGGNNGGITKFRIIEKPCKTV